MKRLIDELKADHFQPALVHPLVRLLASRHHLSPGFLFDQEAVSAMLDSSLHYLSEVSSVSDPLALQTSLDYCALV